MKSPVNAFGERELALVAWSAVAEPADVLAHALVEALGPAEALTWVRLASTDAVAATMALAPHADPPTVERVLATAGRWASRLPLAEPERHVARAARLDARAIPRDAPEWPSALNDLGPSAPFCLWVRGAARLDHCLSRAIAVVGSRSSTAYGEHMAAAIASGLVDERWTVVSGGAYGIDARAHRGALAANGQTVVVLAGGVDYLYPQGNASVFARVIETGAVVAEQPPGFPPHRSRFLTRNRIIAAADATVVVEAAHRSGALNTATHAAELGRPVGAVPGPATSAASAGCHRLIRNGATCVTSAQEVMELVSPLDATRSETPEPASSHKRSVAEFASPGQRRAFDVLGARGYPLERIARDAGLSAPEARAALGALEVEGTVERDGVLWRRRRVAR